MLSKNVDVTACGQGLNISQRLAVANALNKLRLNEKLTNVSFWGKIQARERDYFIAQSVTADSKITKTRYFSHDNGVSFAKLPELDSFIIANAPLHQGRFSGNPSLKLRDPRKNQDEEDEEEEEEYDEDEEGKTRERKLTEIERLAYVIDQVETACCVVPRGSWYMSATGDIRQNVAFNGVSLADAGKLDSFLLFRPPQHEKTLALIHRAGVANSLDFLDTLSLDPTSWSLVTSTSGETVTLRSLAWPGFEFTAEVGSTGFGRAYFGTGEPNTDLAFML